MDGYIIDHLLSSQNALNSSHSIIRFFVNMKRINGTNTKRRKILEETKTIEFEDRISRLPDNVIGHILSFLPTKYAVGTIALSTLWKDQWKLIPNLDFDERMLMDTSKMDKMDINIQTSFILFVYQVLYYHKAPQIREFRLACRNLIDASHLDAWISTVLSRKIQKLELHFELKDIRILNSEVFRSSTLVELRISSSCVLDVPALVYLPNLKTIYFLYTRFRDNESVKRLFSSCPVLEDLTMLYCNCLDLSIFDISSPTVKRLTAKNQFGIELNTPRLEYLSYVGELEEESIPKRLESLAKVCFHVPRHVATEETLKALAQGISNVQFLYLSGEVLEKLGVFRVELEPLNNLRTLAIGYNKYGAWNMVPILLEKCPNLKYLELNNGLFGIESIDEDFKWVTPKVVPACLLLHVEEIKIHEFEGKAQELKMIRYLLTNARVLKNLTVISAMANAEEERKFRYSMTNLAWRRGLRDFQVAVVS